MNTKYIRFSILQLCLAACMILGANALQAQSSVCAYDSVQLQLAPYNGTVQWQESSDNITFTNIPGATNPTVTVLPANEHYYRAEILDGTCNATYSETATVIPAQRPTISASSTNVRPGDTAVLTSSPGLQYFWSNSGFGQSISIVSSGSYWVTVTDSNGCVGVSDTVNVTVSNLQVNVGNDTTVNCSDTIQLNASAVGGQAPFTYQWSPPRGLSDPTIANPILYPICASSYSVVVTDTNGCSGTDTINFTVTGAPAPDSMTFTYTGSIAQWVVPSCVNNVTIKAWGAGGGNSTWSTLRLGGQGAYMQGDFQVCAGDTLYVLVGQQGESAAVGGGGGGSFVALNDSTPLIVAGAGGGASSDAAGVSAVTTQNGTMDSQSLIMGGSNGNGGNACTTSQNNGGGGGGFFTDGQDAQPTSGVNWGRGGAAFVNGGTGGAPGRADGACNGDAYGGFGGGGSTTCNTVGGGGGGGYSGGAGGPHIGNCGASPRAGGGGGGSFNAGTNQSSSTNANTGNGQITIIW